MHLNLILKSPAMKLVLLLILAMFLTSGCMSQSERQAFREFHELELNTYADAGASRPDLPALSGDSTIEDYLAYAALNNPALEAAFYRWKAELQKIPQARALPDPRFNYGYFIQNVETRVGPQQHRIGVSQMFPWLEKLRLRADVAATAADAARELYEAAKLKLFLRVKDTYAEYYYLHRSISITGENIAIMKYLEQVARTKYTVAQTPYPDIIKAQVEIGKLEDRLRALEELRGPLAARLNAALGRPADTEIPWPKALSGQKILLADDELRRWLLLSNPELKALDFGVEKARTAVNLARQDYFPDFSVGLDYIITDEAMMPGVKDSGKDPIMLGFSISIPIWFEKYRAAEREAEARLRSAEKSLADRQNTLEAEVRLALYGARDAERKINLYRDTLVPKAKQSLKAAQTAFVAGTVDFLNLLDARRLLLEFQLSYERALSDHIKKVAELEMLLGREVPRLSPDASDPKTEEPADN